jgi:hypothetical protein
MISGWRGLILSLWIFSSMPSGQEDVVLDKLSDCVLLTQIWARLDAPLSTDCRSPRDAIERKVMSQFASLPDVHSCLLSSAPLTGLAGFSCVEVSAPSLRRELACFRTAQSRLLVQHEEKFDSVYGQKDAAYITDASKCSIGKGGATRAAPGVFPSPLLIVAKSHLGFALVGTDKKSQAYHGFGDLAPELNKNGTLALEVFDVFRLDSATANVDTTTSVQASGEFEFQIDDALYARRTLARSMSQQFSMPVVDKMRFIDLTYRGTRTVPMSTKASNLNDWQDRAGSVLEDAGFRTLTNAELAAMPMKPDDMRDYFTRNMSFGTRDLSHRTLGPHIIFLVDDRYDPCTAIAEVFILEPEKDVKSDYGSIAVLLIGAGTCASLERQDGALSEHVLEKITQTLKDQVNNR